MSSRRTRTVEAPPSHAMMAAVAQFSFVIPPAETQDLAGDLRDLFSELEATLLPEQRVYSGNAIPRSTSSTPRTASK